MSQKQRGKRRDSGRRQRGEEGEEEPMETQQEEEHTQFTQINRQAQKAADSMDSTLMARKVSEMVRYLLCAEQKKVPVRRKELIDKVLMEYSRAFPVVFEKANDQLREVFGVEAREIQKGKQAKFYILVNCLSSSKRDALVEWSRHDEAHTGLLSVVLSLIMMKQGQLKEDHLWVSLKRLGIEPELPHRQFGDVQRLVTKDFVEQMYLNREKVTAGDSYIFWYSWGPRAEQEVDKRELLALVAEIHGGDLSQWERQFLDIRPPQPSPSVTD